MLYPDHTSMVSTHTHSTLLRISAGDVGYSLTVGLLKSLVEHYQAQTGGGLD